MAFVSPSFLTDTVVPAVAFVVMAIVGTEVSLGGARRAASSWWSILVCTSAQVTLLPLAALIVVALMRPDPALALGLLVLAVSPAGSLSNFYTYLNRGNVGLSVALTAVCSLLAVATVPVAAPLAFRAALGASFDVSYPLPRVLAQLTGFVLAPVLIGMALRWRWPGPVLAWRPRLERFAAWLVASTLLIAIMSAWSAFAGWFGVVAAMSVTFTLAALALGRAVATLVPAPDRTACTIECAVRNVPVALMILTNMVPDGLAIALTAGYFLVNVPILVTYSLAARVRATA